MQNIIRSLLILGILISGLFVIKSFAEQTKVELTPTNFVALRTEVTGASVNKVLASIYNSDPTKTFYLFIKSPGGSVFDGLRLVNYLQSTKRPITCVASEAVSMAFTILQSCSTRMVTDSAILMTHEVGVDGDHEQLNETKNRVKIEQQLEDYLDNLLTKRLHLTQDQYRAKITPEWWLIGSEVILKNSAADLVVSVTCSPELERAKESETFQTPFGDVVQTIPLCPL